MYLLYGMNFLLLVNGLIILQLQDEKQHQKTPAVSLHFFVCLVIVSNAELRQELFGEVVDFLCSNSSVDVEIYTDDTYTSKMIFRVIQIIQRSKIVVASQHSFLKSLF